MSCREFPKPNSTLDLSYNISARQALSERSERLTVFENFFGTQNQSYCHQLDGLLSQIHLSEGCATGIVMPCAQESAGIQRAITALIPALKRREDVSLLIVLNSCSDSNAQLDNQKAIQQTILPLQDQFKNLSYIELSFEPSVGCLGRARKYGLDTFLRHFWKTRNPDGKVIFLEADMISCDDDIVEQYEVEFAETGKLLLQGRVHYPNYCSASIACRTYLSYRDIVPRALGSRQCDFPLFLGPMAIGRNFAVQAYAAAAANSFDPYVFDGAEDDIIFGMDISVAANNPSVKGLTDATVVTNPRRELQALHTLHESQGWDHFMSYDCFGKERLSRPTDAELLSIVNKIVRYEECNGALIDAITEPSLEWISRALQKEIIPESIAQKILDSYINHEASYWQTEAAFEKAIEMNEETTEADSRARAKCLLEEFVRESTEDRGPLEGAEEKVCLAE